MAKLSPYALPIEVASIDTRRMSELVGLAAAMGREVGEMLPDEARLTTDQLIANTPGFARFGAKAGAKGTADRAVERGVRGVLGAAEELPIIESPKDSRIGDRVKELVRARDTQALAIVLPRVGTRGLREPGQMFPASPDSWHDRSRSYRGRPSRSAPAALVRRADRKRVAAKKKRAVGRAKAGWGAAARVFGTKIPAWIGRHGTAEGYASDRSKNTRDPFVVISNRVPYISELEARVGIVKRTLRSRAIRLRKRTEAALRHQARKTQSRINR